MDTVNEIELTKAGASSHIFRDPSQYVTLTFIASFDALQTHRQNPEPFSAS